jgi:plasmid stabilization system protein ParE
MTPRYNILPSADRDLDGQAGYLLQEASLETALRFHDAAATTFEKLAHMPGMGERRESPNPPPHRIACLAYRGVSESPHLLPPHRWRN